MTKRFTTSLSVVLLATVVACARAPESPPTSAPAPTTAAASAPTSAPTTVSVPAAAAPTAAAGTGAAGSAPTSAATASTTTAGAATPATAAATGAANAVGGEIVVGKDQEAPGLDPAKNPAQAATRVFDLMYSRLTRLDPQMRAQPDLATNWDISSDGKTYTFHLRQGVKFHNGHELTSADVKYTYERIINPDTASIAQSFFAPIDHIDAPDPYTVVIVLKEANTPFLVNTAATWAGIVAKEVVDANNGDLNKVDAGSGPFILQEWTPDTQTVLVRNPNYYVPGQPAADKITFLIMPDENARIAALRTGNIQFTVLSAAGYDTLKSDTSVKAVEGPTLSYAYLGMNVARPPFDKPQVREAISYAVDRNEIINSVFRGHARPTGPVPSAMTDWAIDLGQFDTYTPNLDKAKQLMSDAGVSNVKTTMIAMSTLSYQVDAAQVIRAQLLKIGIDAEVQPQEVGVYVDNWKKKNMDLMVGGNGSGTNPDRAVCFFFCTDGSANVWNYSNSSVDSDGAEGRTATDQAQAKSVYTDAQKQIVDDAPNLFLANQDQFLAYSPKLNNFTMMPDENWQGLITASVQ
ncbi:MAG: ABC transporter substrate-binding protein [Chloroflexi bacterium]|nr:ABC transporter substrate-binding protein [Chloroflexota bacterium]